MQSQVCEAADEADFKVLHPVKSSFTCALDPMLPLTSESALPVQILELSPWQHHNTVKLSVGAPECPHGGQHGACGLLVSFAA